ncbi:hypothetical protein XENOCAPTIV_004483 [Xenoophorus captivus]|uniref:Uncharacterized protein n=1 Tax=Xenoophorus captivus TaxID=1517983 RepID=A0ABV0S7K9_9TELE
MGFSSTLSLKHPTYRGRLQQIKCVGAYPSYTSPPTKRGNTACRQIGNMTVAHMTHTRRSLFFLLQMQLLQETVGLCLPAAIQGDLALYGKLLRNSEVFVALLRSGTQKFPLSLLFCKGSYASLLKLLTKILQVMRAAAGM